MLKRILVLLFFITQITPVSPAYAQEPTPTPTTAPASGPVYIIQPGDSLSSIASRFGISLPDLMSANNITDANNISAGAQVVIPGLNGVTGVLTTEIIGYGDTLQSLSRRNQVSEGFLRKLNHITTPSELYAGVGLVLPQKDNFNAYTSRTILSAGDTLLEAAVREKSDPWTLTQLNYLNGTWASIPGDVLYTPIGSTNDTQPSGMPSAFAKVSVSPLPMTQGGTSTIFVTTQPGVTLGGILVDKPLRFFQQADGQYVALEGINGILDPGAYPLELDATLPDGSKQTYLQMVLVQSGHYPTDPLLVVNPDLIDPKVADPELAQLVSIVAPATPTKYWQGLFQAPGYFSDCFTSRYGNRRTYEGTGTTLEISGWHTGLDFCGGAGLPISAPADGVVIFAGPLTVRGNATIIDHGWGVYSGFWHQSEIKVQVGQMVKKGDIIGLVGGTGRVTGPHLHWEVWVNGNQVNPMDWLNNVYP